MKLCIHFNFSANHTTLISKKIPSVTSGPAEVLHEKWQFTNRGSQPFSDHVPLISTDEDVSLNFPMTKWLSKITKIHWIFNRNFRNLEL